MAKVRPSLRDYVDNKYFSVPQIAASTAAYLREGQESEGNLLTWGLPTFDTFYGPFVPRCLHTILAKSHHGKTAILCHLARRAEELCRTRLPDVEGKKPAVLHVVLEESCDEALLQTLADPMIKPSNITALKVSPGAFTLAISQHLGRRIVMVGDTLHDAGLYNRNLEGVPEGVSVEDLKYIYDHAGKAFSPEWYFPFVIVDYAQAFRMEGNVSRYEQYVATVNSLVHFAKNSGAAVIAGAQALMRHGEYGMPGREDTELGRILYQKSQTLMAVVKPSEDGADMREPYTIDGRIYTDLATDHIFIKRLKWRGRPATPDGRPLEAIRCTLAHKGVFSQVAEIATAPR